jgi:hypothetical protein
VGEGDRGTGVSGWRDRVAGGAFLILEGDSAAGRAFGFLPTGKFVLTASVVDSRSPKLEIVWDKPTETAVFNVPAEARVFVRERWTGAPLVAGFRRGKGAVLWLAVSPGPRGRERFPYLVQALADLGLTPPFRSRGLWAFFDSSYRARADADYLTGLWERTGIRGLHVAAWHYFEPDAARDQYLHRLIESCHRRGILVYAWLELPHVSDKFWEEHPEWREKTALLADAKLDWRKLMNLVNPECARAAASGVRALVERFDWDGVNLAELYFESLQGYENPSRFTPMNADVRTTFCARAGFDPLDLFNESSDRYWTRNAAGLRVFLDYRRELTRQLQAHWIAELEVLRAGKPDLDLVLTQVDSLLDEGMREAIAADSTEALHLLDRHDFTFMVEDPATLWHLGAERYERLAGLYRALTRHQSRLALDINIADRYQDVYPTRQQTGTELFQLIASAARAFPRVALYVESSIKSADAPWLSSAAAAIDSYERRGAELAVRARGCVGVAWEGPALVNGRPWPAADGTTLWLPKGQHKVTPSREEPFARLLSLTGELLGASLRGSEMEIQYESPARAFVQVDRIPGRVEIDGKELKAQWQETPQGYAAWLPRGRHSVKLGPQSTRP